MSSHPAALEIWYVSPLPWLVPGSAVALVVSLLASDAVGRWLGVRRGVAWVLLLTLGVILSGTLTPLDREPLEGSIVAGTCDMSRIRPASPSDLALPSDVIGNILMFVPLGFAVGLIPGSRRKAFVAAGLVALPFAIELFQLVVAPLNRGCESADVVDNLTGLVIGVAAGTAVRWLGPAVGKAFD